MGLFSRKPSFCAVCNKELTHKHKPKREWNIKGRLCGDCHFDKSKEYYEGKVRQPCVKCGTTRKITDLWEPRWQWEMEGLLCKECFIDHRENIKIIGADTPQDAVKKILELISTSYNNNTESTDAEILDAFNKIKSGEASRMAQKSSD